MLNVNPISYLGFGVMWQFCADTTSFEKNEDVLEKKAYSIRNLQSFYVGVNYRATPKLRTGFYYGLNYSGTLRYQGEDNTGGLYEINDFRYFSFPTQTLMIPVEYRFSDSLSIKGMLLGHGGQTKLMTGDPGAGDSEGFATWICTLSFGYSFSL